MRVRVFSWPLSYKEIDFSGEDTHIVSLTHTLSEIDFFLIAFRRRMREEFCSKILQRVRLRTFSRDRQGNAGKSQRPYSDAGRSYTMM